MNSANNFLLPFRLFALKDPNVVVVSVIGKSNLKNQIPSKITSVNEYFQHPIFQNDTHSDEVSTTSKQGILNFNLHISLVEYNWRILLPSKKSIVPLLHQCLWYKYIKSYVWQCRREYIWKGILILIYFITDIVY